MSYQVSASRHRGFAIRSHGGGVSVSVLTAAVVRRGVGKRALAAA